VSTAAALFGESERRLPLFGSEARALVADADADAARLAALSAEALLRNQQRLLTRFDPTSELSRLNADPRETVAASSTVVAFVLAARWAHERSGGLVDATVGPELERSGYRESLAVRPEPIIGLDQALRRAPRRRAAVAREVSPWDRVFVDAVAGTVTRPPGVRFDSGGITKGHAADLAAAGLERFAAYAVDCGGDIRLGGGAGIRRRVEVTDPWSGGVAATFDLAAGAVATTGINRRLWFDGERYAHHVIDPGRGTPAWTGLVQATAVAPSGLEAEVLAKAAFLSGPEQAAAWLGRWGGAIVDDVGSWRWFGPLEAARGAQAVA
jgi:thiamine biosynthesis lipoprotein